MIETTKNSKVITDRLLRSWVRCRRKAWLDKHGDYNLKAWSAHRSLQLDHQNRSFIALMQSKPSHGLEACSRGEKSVIGIRLKGFSKNKFLIESHPPLIQRIEGESRWGAFSYRPVIARQGR